MKADAGAGAVLSTSRIIAGPAGIDKVIQAILVDAINKSTADPEFIAAMKKGEFDFAGAKPKK